MTEHSRDGDGDLISTSAAESVGHKLDLRYEYKLSYSKVLKITGGAASLFTAILFSQRHDSTYAVFVTCIALGACVRLIFGSPMERRLTAASLERLRVWLASEEHPKESSHVGDSE